MRNRPSTSQIRWALQVTAVILWLFVVAVAYFWAHKPFDAGIVAGLGKSLASVTAWLGITWLGAALGRRVSGGALSDERAIARLALSAGIGLGLLSLLMLGLGLVGALRPAAAWGLILVLGVALRRDLRASLTDLGSARLPRPKNGFQRWLVVVGVASLLLTFLLALAPPTGWDTLVYHLTGPRLFVEAGRIVHPVDLPYLGFPQLGEMQFALGLLLVGEGTAPLFHFGYGLLALAITASLAYRFFGQDVAWLAGALFLSVPTLFSLMSRAYVDATLLFYATASLYAFLCWRDSWTRGDVTRANRWLIVVGLLCGFCGGVKYTAVVIPIALGMSLAWTSRRDGIRAVAERLVRVAVVAVVVAVPWAMENWVTTGNPVYPFFFGGVYWDGWRSWWYDRPGTGLVATAPWRLLTAPLEVTILGTEGTELYEATIGPLLLAGGVLLVVVWRSLGREERAVVGHMLLFSGVNYALWLNGLARTALLLQTRLLFLVFGVLAVLGGVALDRLKALRRRQLDVAWLARAVVSLTLALLSFSMFVRFVQSNPFPSILGLESRGDYLTRRLGWYYAVIEDINRELPSDAVVLFLWEPRSYHCQIQCWPDALLDRLLHTIHLYGYDSGAIAASWRAAGVTHVLLHRVGLTSILEAQFDPVTPADMQVLDDLCTHYLSPAGEWGDAYVLYELVP
jgi:4-amino-4-deoxy-L-arabinose transferase-like glycosyltransferase